MQWTDQRPLARTVLRQDTPLPDPSTHGGGPQDHQAPPTEPEYPDPAELTDPLPTITNPQEVLLINNLGSKGGKNSRPRRRETTAAGAPRHDPNSLYFRCREEVTLPAAPRARTAFIPIELYYRDRSVTAEELRRSCVES